MRIAIVGNGPSRELFYRRHARLNFDVVIGCNIPPENITVDYCCFVDAAAARQLRSNMPENHRLDDFRLVLGERCAGGLSRVKWLPGGVDTMIEYLEDNDHVEEVIRYPGEFRSTQRYFSAGHLAYLFAYRKYSQPGHNLHIFGFDSLFTGDHRPSHSNLNVQEKHPKKVAFLHRDRKHDLLTDTANVWHIWWEMLLQNRNHFDTVSLYGWEGDNTPTFDDVDNLIIEHLPKENCMEYFEPEEFYGWVDKMDPNLLVLLDLFRAKWGKAITVSPAPGAVGRPDGKDGTTSRHNIDRYGTVQAVDLFPTGFETKEDWKRAYDIAEEIGLGGFGVYPDWKPAPGIHIDVRPRKDDGSMATWSAYKVDGKQKYFPVEKALT